MERHACDITSVALECEQRIRVRGLYIVELDGVVTRRSKEALVGRDAESIDLGVGMLDRSRAYAG